jgi:hypothetical protein
VTLHKTNYIGLILTGMRQEKSFKVQQVFSFPRENALDLHSVVDGLLDTYNGGTAFPFPNHCKANCKLRSN